MKVCQGTPPPPSDSVPGWVNDWMTDRPTLRMITEIACDCQLGFSFGKREKQQTKGQSQFSLRYWCAFHGNVPPKTTQKRNSFPGWWAWGQLGSGVWRQRRNGNRRKQLLIDFGLSFGIWQISCLSLLTMTMTREKERVVESVRRFCVSPLCVHVAALSFQIPPIPLYNPLWYSLALTNVCRLLIETAKLANSRKAATASWKPKKELEKKNGNNIDEWSREREGRYTPARPQIWALISSQ